MTRVVQCSYLKREGEGLSRKPLPGDLGERIFSEICVEAWKQWLQHQTMLINEKRLSPINPEDRKYLEAQCEAFLFGGEYDQADGYVPPDQSD